MIVYHYTTEDAYNQIMRDKEFLPSYFSTALDAIYGEGWYFTDLPPSTPDEELYYHLWGHPEPNRVKRYLMFDIEPTILENKRPHVYRLPLERVKGGVIKLDLHYTLQGRIVIKFIRGGLRR